MSPSRSRVTERNQQAGHDHSASLAGRRVLIVEDMGLIVEELRWMLGELGCVVVDVAARVPEATNLARTADVDGVLLDLNLAGEEAYPVADILRERGIPFIIMSGYDEGQLRSDYATAPYLQKPFNRDELGALMRRLMAR